MFSFLDVFVADPSRSSQNAGQNCIGIERLIVHTSQHDDLYEILHKRIDKLRVGSVMAPNDEGYISPIDCGSMILGDRFASIKDVIQQAEEYGARVEGGTEFQHAYYPRGTYFRPALVGPATSDMRIAQEERKSHMFDLPLNLFIGIIQCSLP